MRPRSWWLVLLAMAIYAGVLYIAHPNPKATIDATPGSSASAQPMGDLALAQLWPRLGLSFQTFAQVPELLPKSTNAVYVSVEPQSGQYNTAHAKALVDYVKAGHEVIWVTSSPDTVTHLLKLTVNTTGTQKVHSVQIRTAGDYTLLRGLNFSASSELGGSGLKAADSLMVANNDIDVGAEFQFGKGELVVWTAPQVFENQAIGKAQNLQILWHFSEGKSILWDEYGHGIVAQGMWATLFGHGREGTLLLLLATVVAVVMGGSTRFGALRPAPDEQPRVDVELVHALAWHYRRRGLSKARQALLDGAVRRRLCKLYGMPGTASWEVLDTVVLPSLSPSLQQAYAQWRTEDGGDGMKAGRAAQRRKLRALQSLLYGLRETSE